MSEFDVGSKRQYRCDSAHRSSTRRSYHNGPFRPRRSTQRIKNLPRNLFPKNNPARQTKTTIIDLGIIPRSDNSMKTTAKKALKPNPIINTSGAISHFPPRRIWSGFRLAQPSIKIHKPKIGPATKKIPRTVRLSLATPTVRISPNADTN